MGSEETAAVVNWQLGVSFCSMLHALRTDAASLIRLPKAGEPALILDTPAVHTRFPVTQTTFIEQPNRIYCSAAVIAMAMQVLAGRKEALGTLAEELGTSRRWGTRNEALTSVAANRLPEWRVSAEQESTEPKDMPFQDNSPWRIAAFHALRCALARDAFVIVNYREPVENAGHFAIVQSLSAVEIQLADPLAGFQTLPLSKFDWRSGFSNPVRRGWRLRIER